MKTLLAGLLIAFLGMSRIMAADAADNGPLIGIGVGIHLVDKQPTIDQVLPEQPAFKGGVKVGDRLLKIDGKSVEGIPLPDISKMLQGTVGSRVHITILRPGEKSPRTFSIKRQIITMPGSSLPKGP